MGIISLGGGAFINEVIRKEVEKKGISIWLKWNSKTLIDRINKNKKSYDGDRMGLFDIHTYSKKYGGQFHFDVIGLKKRKILGMSGFGGQQVIVDFDTGRIIVVHSLDKHYNWKKIVHKKLKQK